jgi:hypothetical protein
MSIFDDDFKDKEILTQWCTELGITFNKQLRIKNTDNRGIGVFYKIDKKLENKNDEKIELLRIPNLSSYNIYTLKTLVNENLNEIDLKTVKKVLNIIFKNYGISESSILIAYFISFLVICKKDNKNNNKNNDKTFIGWKNNINQYLNILLETKVGNMYSDQQNILEDLLMVIPGNAILRNSIIDIIGTKWIDIVNEINEEINEDKNFEKVNIEEVLQICSAVRSRILEIPREADIDTYDDEEDEDNYYVDVTLVPILDFVNHDNKFKNAYFDVDRKTKEIILYLDLNKIKKYNNEEEIEVFISYDTMEDLHSMFINYGFIPDSENNYKIIDIPIIGYCDNNNSSSNPRLHNYEATKRLYLIKQTPNIQFKIEFDKNGDIKDCRIIDFEFYSYLIFKENIDWNRLEEEEEEEEEEKEEEEEEEDEQSSKKNGGEHYKQEAIPIELAFEKGFKKCINIINGIDKEELNELKKQLHEYIIEFFNDFNNRINNFIEIIEEYELPKRETTNVIKLLNLYIKICEFFLKKENNKIYNYDEIYDNGEVSNNNNNKQFIFNALNYRLIPEYNFEASVEGVELGELSIK